MSKKQTLVQNPELSLALCARSPKMRVLLYFGQDCISDLSAHHPFKQTQALPQMIKQAFAQAADLPNITKDVQELNLQAVKRVFVEQGPGSFAGLRSILAWAIGFCLPLPQGDADKEPEQAPSALHLFTGFEAFQSEYQQQVEAGLLAPDLSLLFALDSRRDALFFARYKQGECLQSAQTSTQDLQLMAQSSDLHWCDEGLDLSAPFKALSPSPAAIWHASIRKPAVRKFTQLAYYGRQADVDPHARQN